jgi:hypothetical protein
MTSPTESNLENPVSVFQIGGEALLTGFFLIGDEISPSQYYLLE